MGLTKRLTDPPTDVNRGRTLPSTDLSLATHPRPEAEHEPSKY